MYRSSKHVPAVSLLETFYHGPSFFLGAPKAGFSIVTHTVEIYAT